MRPDNAVDTSVQRLVATVPWPSPSTLKIKNVKTVFGSVYCQYSAVYTKMFNFRRTTLFCLEKRFSKHKITIFSTNLGGGMAPLALPWLRLFFDPPLGNFLRTPLAVEPVYHQNRTKRGSRANCQCQRWEHLPALLTFKFSAKITHTLGIPTPVISTRTGVVATWYLGEDHPTIYG